MTATEALAEARRRWGKSAAVAYRATLPLSERYAVGVRTGENGTAHGVGGSYVEAFARVAP